MFVCPSFHSPFLLTFVLFIFVVLSKLSCSTNVIIFLQCATIYQKYVPFPFQRTITEHDLSPFPCPVSSLTHSLTTLWRIFSRSRNWYHFCCSNRETQPWKSHNGAKRFLKLPKSGKNTFLSIKLTFVWQPDNFIWWANSMPMASISTDVHTLNWKNCSQMVK